MSSGQKQCAEDEDDWDALKKRAGVEDTNWQVYSNEATAARRIFQAEGSTGIMLKLKVKHEIERANLHRKQMDELRKLADAQETLREMSRL